MQGIILAHNTTARVIRSNQSLVLQKVTRQSSGNYSCSAINAEGETVSNQLELRVKCKFVWFGYILLIAFLLSIVCIYLFYLYLLPPWNLILLLHFNLLDFV